MEPTPEQLRELYIISYQLTAQLRCYLQLIELLPNKELCIVVQPSESIAYRMLVFINPDGGRRYV